MNTESYQDVASARSALAETTTLMRDTGDFAFAMMALALARLSVHEANVETEDSIQRARMRMLAR